MTNIDFPFRIDGRGRTAATSDEDHLRDLIEQFLFTSPGERVNRPDFGSGLLQLVFAPGGPELEATTRFLVEGGLQQWLGDRIEVEGVEVRAEDGTLHVSVQYLVRRSRERRVAAFAREI
jgi:uncharacterized protein